MNRYRRLFAIVHELIALGPESQGRRKRADAIGAAARADGKRRPRRKPPEEGMPVPAVPPKGPLPKQGGAEAALRFD